MTQTKQQTRVRGSASLVKESEEESASLAVMLLNRCAVHPQNLIWWRFQNLITGFRRLISTETSHTQTTGSAEICNYSESHSTKQLSAFPSLQVSFRECCAGIDILKACMLLPTNHHLSMFFFFLEHLQRVWPFDLRIWWRRRWNIIWCFVLWALDKKGPDQILFAAYFISVLLK